MSWPPEFDACFVKNRTQKYNSDIEGPGVVYSFVVSGWLTVSIVLCNYLFVFDPRLRPFRRSTHVCLSSAQENDEDLSWVPNPLDIFISDSSSRVVRPVKAVLSFLPVKAILAFHPAKTVCDWFGNISTREKAGHAFIQCVMSLCDIQLLTGISMLLSGFVSLSDFEYMDLSSWFMITELGWFSNLTHQCGLVFLRSYLYENPRERMWRLILMSVLFVALVTAMTPTIGAVVYDPYFGAQSTTPAICFYRFDVARALYTDGNINRGSITGSPSFQICTVSTIILILSFAARLIKLFETSSRFIRTRIRAPVGRMLRRILRRYIATSLRERERRPRLRTRIFWLENPLLAIYIYLRIAADIATSVFSDVIWLLLSAIFGTKQLLFQRSSLEQLGKTDIHPEASLGSQLGNFRFDFGQILPLVLLGGVAISTRQAFQFGRLSAPFTDTVTHIPLTDTDKYSRQPSLASTLAPASETTSRIDHLLSRDVYIDKVWLLPTLLNIGASIFLFFQSIASSGGETALSLITSIFYVFAVISVACGAIIVIGLAVADLRWGGCLVWTTALQPLAAINFLIYEVMKCKVSFGNKEQLLIMMYGFLGFCIFLAIQYAIICVCICCWPTWSRRTLLAATGTNGSSGLNMPIACTQPGNSGFILDR